MDKQTQTIHRQFADELFECAWPFCGVGAKGVKEKVNYFAGDVKRSICTNINSMDSKVKGLKC